MCKYSLVRGSAFTGGGFLRRGNGGRERGKGTCISGGGGAMDGQICMNVVRQSRMFTW